MGPWQRAPSRLGLRWLELATLKGAQLPDAERRISKLVDLWHAPIPAGWERERLPNRLLDRHQRYCRGGTALRVHEPREEHLIEHEILDVVAANTPTICLGAPLVDGVNAVPLSTDAGGERTGNVEADMLLLVGRNQDFRLLLVEVKVNSNNAWYAAVENLRQLKLFLGSAAPRALFRERLPGFCPRVDLPITAVVLAPKAFYAAEHKKAAAVAPARTLLQRMRDEVGIDAVLATWSLSSRVIETYNAG